MALLLLLAFSSIFNEGMAAEGLDFVVSPEPAYFTVHPRSDVVLEGTTVTLRCSARVVDIGGFRRPLHTDTVPWRRYEIDWEFMPASKRDAGVPAANMHFTAAEKDVNLEVVNYRDTQGMTLNSTLTISGSMLSNSGAYRCAVQDWELKYTSYHGLIQIIPREATSHREMTVAPLSVRLPCRNQTEGNWWNHFQTTSWAVVENGGNTTSINSSMGFTMSNGDLVLYGGFPSLHLECHRHWTNAFGLPVANESHTLRLHVSETGEHDIVTEDLVTAWLGDRVELLCNLSLQDDTVAWYHDDRRLASDGSGGYVFDPSGPILQFQALSASYQGWYVCTSRENRRHSTQLIIRGRKDLNGVSSAAGLQGQTHYISTGDATKALDCNTPEDPEDKVLLYEWTIDGVFANTSAASLSASHTGVYVCYSHLKDKTLATTHRVLPHGYVNPITNLEYPRAEVVGGTTSDPIVNLHFSWRPPEVLGGLTSTDIQYRVQLMTEGGVTVAADVIPDLFFERNFSGFDNITTRMSITVSVEPHDSSLAPSLPTVIPYAAVLEWYRFDIKVYCNSTHLKFHVKNPLYHLLAYNNLRYYHARLVGNYYSIRLENETVTGNYLRKNGKLTEFSSNYELPIPDKYIKVKHELWSMDEGNVGQGTIHKERYRSAAVAFYPSFAERDSPNFFLRHFQEDDYYICNFEDPPEISFSVGYIEIVGTLLVHSAFLHLSKPSGTRFLAQVIHDEISQDVWVEPDQVEVPFNLTPTHGSVQYTLTVNEDYDNVATVGQNRILVVNFTRPTRTNTNTTEEPTEEDTSSDNRVDLTMALTTAGVAGVVISAVGLCLCLAYLQRKSRLKGRATELETGAIEADSDKQLYLVEIGNIPVDDVTDYDVCSRRSFDLDVTCSTSETSVSMQLKTTPTHTKGSSDYTRLWTGGMEDGCDSLPLGYTRDSGSPAQTPSCECADAQSYSSGIQFPQTDDTTCTTCTAMAMNSSGHCISWSTSTPDTSTSLVCR